MKFHPGRRFCVPLLTAALVSGAVFGAPEEKSPKVTGVWGVYFDNDLFARTDRDYTNGVRALWASRPKERGGADDPIRFWSLAVGQSMYTPKDTDAAVPDPNDRPYAGYSHISAGFHRIDGASLITLDLGLGLVGPHSFAGSTQRFVHRLLGYDLPMGWDHQLRDELILALRIGSENRLWRIGAVGFGTDGLLRAGASLSNAVTAASAGFEVRAGWNLPGDFGSSHFNPGSDPATLFEERSSVVSGRNPFGAHLYFALNGQAVARDIFLDGNTFRDGPRVQKIPFRAEWATGFSIRWKRLRASFGYVLQTRQFETQGRRPIFGAVGLAYVLSR